MDAVGGLVLVAIILVSLVIMAGMMNTFDYCLGVRVRWEYVSI